MLEFVLYAAVLGLAMVFVVPTIATYAFKIPGISKLNLTTLITRPTGLTVTSVIANVIFWGALLAGTLFLFAMIRPVRRILEA